MGLINEFLTALIESMVANVVIHLMLMYGKEAEAGGFYPGRL